MTTSGEGFGGDLGKARRTLGMGACPSSCSGDDGMAARMLEAFNCNISDMPVILQSRSMFTGPVPDTVLNTLFAANIDMLGFGKSVPGAAEVSLNGITNGQASTHFLICGVFAHFTPPPFNFTVPGAAWTAPTSTGGQPVIPDEWTSQDTGTSNGALGLTGSQTLTKAYLDYGNWVQEGFYEWARAYNWLWTNGEQTTLLNWPLRHIAKVVPAPQSDTSVTGAISPDRYIAQANAYYRAGGAGVTGNAPATSAIFLRRNARRMGSATTTGTTITSLFSPDSTTDLVTPTIGGSGVQELGCNTEYFRLPSPVVFPRSVSLNMTFQVVSTTAQKRVQNAFSMTDGIGGTPPGVILQDVDVTAANFTGTGTASTFSELTADTSAVNPLKTPIGTAVFKIGDWWVSVGLVGYELNDTQYDMIRANKGDLSTAFANAGAKLHYWGG
jgi:hypothetical protein